MPDWQDLLTRLRIQAAKVPKILWATAAVAVVSLGIVSWLALSGPPYAVLSEGLSPADGGKVIAQLQKLGIPYQLQEAGNVILVPAPELAQARLQLGASQVPGSSSQTAWNQLENAPVTASDLAQSTMASQALELSLEQSIEAMNGIRSAQVFLAQPPETPFLADQPKPTASVVIDASQSQATAQGASIAAMVAGAVPGLTSANVTVVTTDGITVYPNGGSMNAGSQFAMIEQVENGAAARVAALLTPMVGPGNFRTDVSANLDFTQVQIQQVSYGPTHLVQSSSSSQSSQTGSDGASYGVPGALSNEPPGPTTTTPTPTNAAADANATTPANNASTATGTQAPDSKGNTTSQSKTQTLLPTKTSSSEQQSFVTDQTNSDIQKPSWAVKSVAISVVLNEAALPKGLTIPQIQTAISSAFAYSDVKVNVLSAPFDKAASSSSAMPLTMATLSPLVHSILELLAACALLFGLALPVGRRLANLNFRTLLPPPPPPMRPLPTIAPHRDFTELREHAADNVPGVAQLLQSWVDDNE